jgi:thioredoxin reductase (NADPH)
LPKNSENDKQIMETIKCLIIGAGPAGYTAAIYAARAEMKPVMYVGPQPGGQLMITNDVENFPGYPEGVMGPQMMEDIKKQAERFGTDVRYGTVSDIDVSSRPFKVTVDGSAVVEAETVIIATGASAKWLGIESEQRLNGKGVSACAVCDGFFFRGQEVAIVGAGDTACEEAHYLSKLCRKVHMLVRRNEFRASKIMQARVQNTPNIEIHYNTEVDEVLGAEGVEGVRLKNNQTCEKTDIAVTGLFIAIGHEPNTAFLKGKVNLDEQGYIITVPGTATTNVPGLFASGDAQDKVYRQAVTAAGSGCMAALEAERFLASIEHAISSEA